MDENFQSPFVSQDPSVVDTHIQGPSQPDLPIQEQPVPPPVQKKSFKKLLFILTIVLVVFGISLGSFLTYAVAYEKIDIGNSSLQNKISRLIMSIPFAPKTPRYVLENSLIAHSQTNSHSFDASLSLASESFISEFGTSSFDLKFVGDVDYSESKNINFKVSGNITKEFEGQIIKKDEIAYFKIDKFPYAVLALIGLKSEGLDKVFENWIKYDLTPLNSEARKLIDESKDSESYTGKITNNLIKALTEKRVLEKIKMQEEIYDGVSVYTISYEPSSEDIDYLYQQLLNSLDDKDTINLKNEEQKLSSIINSLKINIKVGKTDNLLRWASVQSTIKNNNDFSSLSYLVSPYVKQDSSFEIAFVMKLNKFNEEVKFELPEKALTIEEYGNMLMERVEESGFGIMSAVNPGRQFSQARDTQRRSDLLQITNAIYQFASEHNGNLPDTDNNDLTSNFPTSPTCIGTSPECFDLAYSGSEFGKDTIVPTYISEVPYDPSTGNRENTGYKINIDPKTGRVIASATGELTENITIER